MTRPLPAARPRRIANLRAILWLLACGVLTSGAAAAHPAPFSYLDLTVDAGGARGALVVHDYDAAHEMGIASPEALQDPATAQDAGARLAPLLGARLRIRLDGRVVSPIWAPATPLPERQSIRLPFSLAAAQPGQIDVDAWLFPYDPAHESFINVYEDGRLAQQAILDATHRTTVFYSHGVQGRWALVRTFVPAGVQHILTGPDHILFLVGLLLLGGPLWRLATIATAFTLGHSITLSLAVLGLVRIAPRIIEPAIALSIVVVGIDNLLVRAERQRTDPRAPGRSRDLRPWLAGGFGLVHGFGFASVLLELNLPAAAQAWSLASFNVGVEIGQLLVLVPVASLLAALRRWDGRVADRGVVAGSIAVATAGAIWFVQRIVSI
jgi:hypothetical protein